MHYCVCHTQALISRRSYCYVCYDMTDMTNYCSLYYGMGFLLFLALSIAHVSNTRAHHYTTFKSNFMWQR